MSTYEDRQKRLEAAVMPDFGNRSSRGYLRSDYEQHEPINQTPDYSHYFKKDEWGEDDVIKLFAQDDPEKLLDLIRASLSAKKLGVIRKGGLGSLGAKTCEHYFNPIVIIEWAIAKELKLPTELIDWYNTQNKPKSKEVNAYAEPVSAKVIQVNSNNTGFSGLLNIPQKADDWFQVIDDMTRAFYNQFTQMPNKVQAWAQLWTTLPDGYEITTSTDKGNEDCLLMPGAKPLCRSAFLKRWGDYTDNKPE